MTLCTPHDDPRTYPVRHSHLKRMALSPAHYLASLSAQKEQTRAMRVGSLVDALVFGGTYYHFQGDRRAKAYEQFEREHKDGVIVTTSEWDDGAPVAEAVLKSPQAAPWLRGKFQVPLVWTDGGRACATKGLDILGDGFIADLKTSHIVAPNQFRWAALRMAYHAQLAWYCAGATQHAHPVKDLVLIAAELHPPYAVQVYRLSDAATEAGAKLNRLWLERLLVCEQSGVWPAYAESMMELDVAADVELEFDDG